jgi:hypothetical protein
LRAARAQHLRNSRRAPAATLDLSVSRNYDEQALTDNKVAALLDERRTAPRDVYDLELLLARGLCPSPPVAQQFGGQTALTQSVSEKLELMTWALFRDQVLPALPREIQANLDEDEYLATKIRLIESLEKCLAKHVDGEAQP